MPSPHHRPFWGEPGVMPASMGRPDYPTPVGTYTVLAKERDVQMDSSSVGIPVDDPDGYLLDVDYAVRITDRGLFVHSAPWAENSLGYDNVSHGCVSLSPTDAEWYFNAVNVGDPVIVQENSVEVPRAVTAADSPRCPCQLPAAIDSPSGAESVTVSRPGDRVRDDSSKSSWRCLRNPRDSPVGCSAAAAYTFTSSAHHPSLEAQMSHPADGHLRVPVLMDRAFEEATIITGYSGVAGPVGSSRFRRAAVRIEETGGSGDREPEPDGGIDVGCGFRCRTSIGVVLPESVRDHTVRWRPSNPPGGPVLNYIVDRRTRHVHCAGRLHPRRGCTSEPIPSRGR